VESGAPAVRAVRVWLSVGRTDRDAGYWWECSMRQVEVSRTVVLDAPRRARSFFEALIADNLHLGRPENVEIIFGRRVRCDTPYRARQHPAAVSQPNRSHMLRKTWAKPA